MISTIAMIVFFAAYALAFAGVQYAAAAAAIAAVIAAIALALERNGTLKS